MQEQQQVMAEQLAQAEKEERQEAEACQLAEEEQVTAELRAEQVCQLANSTIERGRLCWMQRRRQRDGLWRRQNERQREGRRGRERWKMK